MTDIEARADRVRAIVEGNHGKIIERIGDKITFEVPADIAPGLPWGMSGLVPIFKGQTTRLAPRRVVDMEGRTVVCERDEVTTTYYVFEVALSKKRPAEARPPS
jgi:hypothetical protein